MPLCGYSQSRKAQCSGISFIASTSLKVCHNRRIHSHKVFAEMIIKQNRRTGVCYSPFVFEGKTYNFSFNGKKGQPLITTKREAREHESEIRAGMRAGAFIASGPLQNFAEFYRDVFLNEETWKVEGSDKVFRGRLTREFDVY